MIFTKESNAFIARLWRNKEDMYAPIIVFAYNRPEHLERTLKALSANPEAKDSSLFVFIDGPKNELEKKKNKQVESVAQKQTKGCFASVTISNYIENRGLAKSVISGVTEIISRYGKVIVTEDDAIPAISYLKFMNEALDFYDNNLSIWSIGGYTVPMGVPGDYVHDIILTQRSSSYAWATWKNRWERIDWSVSDYKKFHWNFVARKRFNLWGDDRASMLDDQMLGRVNSWAIRFDYAMFRNGMYNILPRRSLIQNIGHDGSGTHSMKDSSGNDPFAIELPSESCSFVLSDVTIDDRIRREFIKPFRSTKRDLIKRFLGNLVIGWKKNV